MSSLQCLIIYTKDNPILLPFAEDFMVLSTNQSYFYYYFCIRSIPKFSDRNKSIKLALLLIWEDTGSL